MKIIPQICSLFLLTAMSGCAKRTVYDSLRYSQEMECQKLLGADQQECLKRIGMSYDEYQKQLKEHPAQR